MWRTGRPTLASSTALLTLMSSNGSGRCVRGQAERLAARMFECSVSEIAQPLNSYTASSLEPRCTLNPGYLAVLLQEETLWFIERVWQGFKLESEQMVDVDSAHVQKLRAYPGPCAKIACVSRPTCKNWSVDTRRHSCTS